MRPMADSWSQTGYLAVVAHLAVVLSHNEKQTTDRATTKGPTTKSTMFSRLQTSCMCMVPRTSTIKCCLTIQTGRVVQQKVRSLKPGVLVSWGTSITNMVAFFSLQAAA